MVRSKRGGRPRVSRRGQRGVGIWRLREYLAALSERARRGNGDIEFYGEPLARVLVSTAPGHLAVWGRAQAICGNFIAATANRAALADPVQLPRAVNLRAALKAGRESLLGARMGALVAVLATSKHPVAKEDGRLVADQLKEARADWRKVASTVTAVQDATSLVHRSRRLMEQAGCTHNYSALGDTRRILLGAVPGWRSPSWQKFGSILAEWIRTQRSGGW